MSGMSDGKPVPGIGQKSDNPISSINTVASAVVSKENKNPTAESTVATKETSKPEQTDNQVTPVQSQIENVTKGVGNMLQLPVAKAVSAVSDASSPPISATALPGDTPQTASNDYNIGIALYTKGNGNTANVITVVDGPGIKNICSQMNQMSGMNVPPAAAVPIVQMDNIASAAANAVTSGMKENTDDNIISASPNLQNQNNKESLFRKLDKGLYNTGEKFAKSYLQRRGIMPKDKNIKNSLESMTGFDSKKADDAISAAKRFLSEPAKGGKSRTAKRRASIKHSLSSRRRSGKIKRKSRRPRRRQRQTKHRS